MCIHHHGWGFSEAQSPIRSFEEGLKMPLYEFQCEKGHVVEAIVKVDLTNAPKECTKEEADTVCGKPLEKKMSINARVFPGADNW